MFPRSVSHGGGRPMNLQEAEKATRAGAIAGFTAAIATFGFVTIAMMG